MRRRPIVASEAFFMMSKPVLNVTRRRLVASEGSLATSVRPGVVSEGLLIASVRTIVASEGFFVMRKALLNVRRRRFATFHIDPRHPIP